MVPFWVATRLGWIGFSRGKPSIGIGMKMLPT